jgi:hypothetical protein
MSWGRDGAHACHAMTAGGHERACRRSRDTSVEDEMIWLKAGPRSENGPEADIGQARTEAQSAAISVEFSKNAARSARRN